MDRPTEIKRFLITEFLPDLTADQLDPDYDLLATGVIDSLQVVRVVNWVTTRYAVPLDQVEITPGDFRSVNAIDAFVTTFEETRNQNVHA
ncbi:acyl carrier protein [Streptomyces hesseae]|uniref:Acyl carrier protein n=1 Tax=Streptomyces hesseae TaxID=3075519 RepID=A0ABU2SM77_9ACTN|nr:acyl carrier protein [Streptomyces sp. DSM 40473]MDT0449995.1 acyl carrier protein [Streptomyces sp. DSM 40473]